jgi:starvation-inducible DNA-binding protein
MLAGELEAHIDVTAERATTLGGTALGRVEDIKNSSLLSPYPNDIASGEDHLHELIKRVALVGKTIRESIDEAGDKLCDQSTADLFTELSRALDLRLWFLEAHVQD